MEASFNKGKKVTRLQEKENRLVKKGNKAVDEGRDKKANRIFGRAARVEDRKIKISEKMKSGGSIAKDGKWMQKAAASIKKRGTKGVCTGAKFGGPTCKPGSKRYALAKTFKKIAKSNKKK
jgi:hypothetical protein